MSQKKDFIYINEEHSIEYSLLIPYEESIDELAHILIIQFNLPIYIEQGNFIIG